MRKTKCNKCLRNAIAFFDCFIDGVIPLCSIHGNGFVIVREVIRWLRSMLVKSVRDGPLGRKLGCVSRLI